MPDKPLISLYDVKGIGIIIMMPTGVLYSNQTGGYSCLHPEEEGAFVPLYNELVDQEAMLFGHFTGPKWGGGCASGIDVETADFVDDVLNASLTTQFLKVDRSRLSDSHEAWTYVDLLIPPQGLAVIEGFGSSKGVLTWPNSD